MLDIPIYALDSEILVKMVFLLFHTSNDFYSPQKHIINHGSINLVYLPGKYLMGDAIVEIATGQQRRFP